MPQEHIGVDGEPSEYTLAGSRCVGIPQGCPLACSICNITAAFWHAQMASTCPSARSWSYLGDRMIIARSWSDLDAVLTATQQLDALFVPRFNLAKSFQEEVGTCPRAHRHFVGEGPLTNVPVTNPFKYLGIDIMLQYGAVSYTHLRAHET